MNIKFLYALGLLLCLSTVASSNECTRFCHRSSCNSASPAESAAPLSAAAGDDAAGGADRAFSLTLIKLLYI